MTSSQATSLIQRINQKISLWKRVHRDTPRRSPFRLIVGRKTYRDIRALTRTPVITTPDPLRDEVYAACSESKWYALEIVKCNRERYLRVV